MCAHGKRIDFFFLKYIENNLGPKFLKENDFEKRKFKNSHPNIIKLPVSIEK